MHEVSLAGMSHDDWLEARAGTLGGSDIPSILGHSPWKSKTELWLEKSGRTPYSEITSPDIQRGQTLEPIVADLYAKQTGEKLIVPESIYYHETLPIHASPDRIIEREGGNAILEIKCPRVHNFRRIKSNGPSPMYIDQVQTYMFVLGLEEAVIAVFSAEEWELLTFPIKRCEMTIGAIESAAAEFWQSIEKDVPPQDSGVFIPTEQADEVLPMTEEIERAIEGYVTAKSFVSRYTAEEKNYRARVITLLNGHKRSDGKLYNLKMTEMPGRKTLDSKKLQEDFKDIINLEEYYKVGKPYYTLNVRSGE